MSSHKVRRIKDKKKRKRKMKKISHKIQSLKNQV